jgi:hypothetical protein
MCYSLHKQFVTEQPNFSQIHWGTMGKKFKKYLAMPKASDYNSRTFGAARFWKIFVLIVPCRIWVGTLAKIGLWFGGCEPEKV